MRVLLIDFILSGFDVVFQILGKAEFLNPGGSVKDRVAVKIIEEVNEFSLTFLRNVFSKRF